MYWLIPVFTKRSVEQLYAASNDIFAKINGKIAEFSTKIQDMDARNKLGFFTMA